MEVEFSRSSLVDWAIHYCWFLRSKWIISLHVVYRFRRRRLLSWCWFISWRQSLSAASYTAVRVRLRLIRRVWSMIHDVELRLTCLLIASILNSWPIVNYTPTSIHIEALRWKTVTLWIITLHLSLTSLRLWCRPHRKCICPFYTFIFAITLMINGFNTWLEYFAVISITTIFSASSLIRRRLKFLSVRLIDSRRSWHVIKLTLIWILKTILSTSTVLVRAISDTICFRTTCSITRVFYCTCFCHPFSRIAHTFFQKV